MLGGLFAGVAAGGEGAAAALGRCPFAALGCWAAAMEWLPGTVTGGKCK